MLEFLGQIWQMLSLKDILTILASGPPSAAFARPSGLKGIESVSACHISLYPTWMPQKLISLPVCLNGLDKPPQITETDRLLF